MLGEALGHEYVDRYLPPEAKARAREMAVNIVNELKISIESRDWMSAPTKAKALEKVSALNIKIGYPDKWKDYAGVHIDRTTYLDNVLSARSYAVRDDLGQIGKPVDRGRWDMTPPTMNAYYNPLMNEIVVPAGYLQPPGFDPKGLDAINYGAVGVSIGHEISHGVDDEGAQFSADGRLEKWWTDADYKNFEARTACTTQQYDNYFVEPGLHLQGKLVTGEALGDLGGVNLAYRAYHRSRITKAPSPASTASLPTSNSSSPRHNGAAPSSAPKPRAPTSPPIRIHPGNSVCSARSAICRSSKRPSVARPVTPWSALKPTAALSGSTYLLPWALPRPVLASNFHRVKFFR